MINIFIIIFLIRGLCLFCIPFMVIWALNTLFALSIVITFKTWLATLILSAIVYGWKLEL